MKKNNLHLLKLGKKASSISDFALFKVLEVVFMIIAILALVGITGASLKTNLDTTDVSLGLFYNRLYTSGAINYVDTTINRAYLGIVDFDKFSSLGSTHMLENDISYGSAKTPIAAKMTLLGSNGEELASYTYNSNKQLGFDELKSRAYAIGFGATTERMYSAPVLIKAASMINGTMEYDLIVVNS